jgi:hypothetical protein
LLKIAPETVDRAPPIKRCNLLARSSWREKAGELRSAALVAAEPGEANRRAQFSATVAASTGTPTKVGFAPDSALEGDKFEPSVPLKRDPLFRSAHQWQRTAHKELCDRRNDQVLDAAKFKQGDGANEAGFGGIAPKNCWK